MEALDMLKKIEKMVRKYLYPNKYDVEDIAVKIFIELLETHRYLSNIYVKNRCIDEMRKARRIKFCPVEELLNIESLKEDKKDSIELVNLLIEQAVLTPKEKELIYLSFYKEEKVPSFLLDKVLEKLRKELSLIVDFSEGY